MLLRWPNGFRCPRHPPHRPQGSHRPQPDPAVGRVQAAPLRDVTCEAKPTPCDNYLAPKIRCTPSALAPFFWLVTYQIAPNHSVRGVCVSCNSVPAITEL